MNTLKLLLFSILLLLLPTFIYADITDEEKILILTNYLIKNEGKSVAQARNKAISTIYGEPKFQNLVYDDSSEMFFAQIVSKEGNFIKDINFYMPYHRAVEFKKDLNSGLIKIEHNFKNNKIIIKKIKFNYKNIDYSLSVKESSKITLKLGVFF